MTKTNGTVATAKDSTGTERTITRIPLAALDPSHNYRQADRNPEDDAALQASMKASGLDKPIEVAGFEKGGKRWIIGGHRRFAAATALGWKEIDAIIRPDVTDEVSYLKVAIRSNIGVRPTAGEQIRAVDKLMKAMEKAGQKPDADAIAESISKSKKHVQNMMRIMSKLHPKVKKAFMDEHQIKGTVVFDFDRAAKFAAWETDQQEKAYDARVALLSGDTETADPVAAAGGPSQNAPGGDPPAGNGTGDKAPAPMKRDAIIMLRDEIKKADTVAMRVESDKVAPRKLSPEERAIVVMVLDYVASPKTPVKTKADGSKVGGDKREIFQIIAAEKPAAKKGGKGKAEASAN